jgi:hypothetical protein
MFKSIFQFLFGKGDDKPKPPAVRRFFISEPFTIVCGSPEFIQNAYDNIPYNDGDMVDAFYDRRPRTLYVPYGKWDKDLPDPGLLGHELMHLPEIGGAYHKQ